MKNAEWMIKNGYKFSDVGYCFVGDDNAIHFSLNGEIVGKASYNSYLEAFQQWLDMEHEPFLDGAEKKYLSAVIKPFRDRVEYIVKSSSSENSTFSSIHSLRGSTLSPINTLTRFSTNDASSILTLIKLLVSGFIVVSAS